MRFQAVTFALLMLLPLSAAAECMGPYPQSMVRAFNQNCITSPDMQPYCSCLLDEVQKNISLADFIEVGNTPGALNADPRFIKANAKCSAQIPSTSGNSKSSAPPVQSGKLR